MNPAAPPSDLEIQALSVLWQLGPSTVAAVLESLPDGKQRAYTTVLSVMQSLERKRLVLREREKSGRAHVYRPAQPRESIVDDAVTEFVTNVFGGSLGEAILAILSTGNLTPEEKTNIERELKRHKAMAAKKTAKKAAPKKAAPKKAAPKKAAAKKKVTAKKPAAPKKKAAPKKAAAKKPAKKKVTAKKAAPKKPAKKVAKKAAPKKPAKKAAKKK